MAGIDNTDKTQQTFTIEIKNVILHKFQSLIHISEPNLSDSIDITPQVAEISIFESILSPNLRAEVSISDEIGLFVNFPMTGEEVISITYEQRNTISTRFFVINSVTAITAETNLRGTMYLINLFSFESYFNARTRVSHSYRGRPDQIIDNIHTKYITDQIKKIYPQYNTKAVDKLGVDSLIEKMVVVPNLHPYKAISWLCSQSVSTNREYHTFSFYETLNGFNIKSLQAITTDPLIRKTASNYGYKYMSNEIPSSTMKNDGRIVTNLKIDRRLSTFTKIAAGYYQNTLFEINMAQKAFFTTQTRPDQITTMEPHRVNREVYELLTPFTEAGDEEANKTRYIINNMRESDDQYPNPMFRDKWGPSIASVAALGQVELTVVIPGNVRLAAGDLFDLTLPEMHGFNQNEPDDLISGMFLITELKHTMITGGFHTTTLKLNKDSYRSSIDRPSRYK